MRLPGAGGCAWHAGSLWGKENVLELGTHEMPHCSPGHGSLYVLCVSLQFKKVCSEHSAPVEAGSGSARPPEPPTHPHPWLAHSSAARCPQPPVSPCPLTELPKPSWDTGHIHNRSPAHCGPTPRLLAPRGAHSSCGAPSLAQSESPALRPGGAPAARPMGTQAPGSATGLGRGLGQASEDILAPVRLPPCPPGDANGVLLRKEPRPRGRSAELTG